MSLPDSTPVLVGIGVASQREEDPANAVEALALMQQATQSALDDCGKPDISAHVGNVAVPKGMWEYRDPARAIASAFGMPARSEFFDIGVSQQTMIGEACQRIADGEFPAALVVGGEAKYRQLRGSILGVEVPESQQDTEPDVTRVPHAEIWSPVESAAGLGMPVGYYAIMESALRADLGESIAENRRNLAQLYADFSRVAADNPDAWNRQSMAPDALLGGTPENRMLAFPYAKYHNSQWNVDQAAALLFCSLGLARELGLDESRFIYPLASSECNHMVNLAQRPVLHECPGARFAGKAALEHAGLAVEELDLLEMYSCFPAAVRIYAREVGVPADRPWTVTGGMTFGGGPLNNFVLQASAKMAQLLRQSPDQTGMVTTVSGMLTKQGFGVWASRPPLHPFKNQDVTEAVRAVCVPLEIVEPVDGEATIVGATVVYTGDTPSRAIAVCDVAPGQRTVVYSEQAPDLEALQTAECVGRQVRTSSEGTFRLS